MIVLSSVSKAYSVGKNKVHALHNISLEIKEGEFAALMGPSGSGKSTLLNLMGGLDKPTHGEVVVQGKDLSKLDDKELSRIRNRNIGFVFQDDLLLPHFTLFENVTIPLMFAGYAVDPVQIKQILHEVGLEKHLDHKPSELSGGQRQRAGIARALAMKPTIVLADEPTGNLDEKTGREIIELFKELHKKHRMTFVIATHDPGIGSFANKTIHITDGKIT